MLNVFQNGFNFIEIYFYIVYVFVNFIQGYGEIVGIIYCVDNGCCNSVIGV